MMLNLASVLKSWSLCAKCRSVGISFNFRTSLRWLFILRFNSVSALPTYCNLHFVHSIKFCTFQFNKVKRETLTTAKEKCTPCSSNNRTLYCRQKIKTTTFQSNQNNRTYTIYHNVNCKCKYIIYLTLNWIDKYYLMHFFHSTWFHSSMHNDIKRYISDQTSNKQIYTNKKCLSFVELLTTNYFFLLSICTW